MYAYTERDRENIYMQRKRERALSLCVYMHKTFLERYTINQQ